MKRITRILFILISIFLLHETRAESTYFSSDQRAPRNYAAMVSCTVAGGICSAITLGPISCSVSAIAVGAYLFYSWCKTDRKQESPHALIVPPEAQDKPSRSTHVYNQIYTLDDKATVFLTHHMLNPRDYRSCLGTEMQHALHQECIELVRDSAQLRMREHAAYKAILADVIDAGRACAHGNAIDEARATLDWARTLLHYVRAVGDGIIDGAQQTIHSLTHPRQFIAQLSRDAHQLVCMSMRVFYECGLVETLIDIDNDVLLDAYVTDRRVYLSALAQRIEQHAQRLMQPQGVRSAVASATHIILTGKCLHAIGKFFSFAARNASCIVQKIGDLTVAQASLATTAESMLVNAAQESAQLVFRAAEGQLPKAKVMRALAAYEPPAVHIERIAQKYPQWATDNCKPLVHILKGHDVKGKLSGLHHDYGGYLEALGHIEVLEQYPNGMYRVNVLYNGGKFEKTFFPKDWSPYYLIDELTKSIKQIEEWVIEGERKTALVKIREREVIVVTELNEHIVTVYPLSDSKIAQYKLRYGRAE